MPEVKSIYQHLELWARDNIPNDECLKMVYFKVKKELENYRD
jgi:Zn ribbon nucleic-acid-binding protein